jgi:hypothetical protein
MAALLELKRASAFLEQALALAQALEVPLALLLLLQPLLAPLLRLLVQCWPLRLQTMWLALLQA